MESLVIEGRILKKLDAQGGTSARGPWRKQDFIIETTEQYPKKVCISCWNEKIDELARYNENDALKVSVNLESREFNNRWYTDIKAWRIEAAGAAQSTPPPPPAAANDDVVGVSFSDEDTELPF